MDRNKIVQSILRISLVALAAKLLFSVKVSFAIGSAWLLFSLRNSIVPLSGAFGGTVGASAFFMCNALALFLFKGAIPLSYLAYSGIPTFFSSLYWALDSRFMRAGIPAICMMLFWAHPIGMQAFPYAFFWVIPFLYAFRKNKNLQNLNLFGICLASTFTAHAVGSVLWLYTTSMPASYWYSLMPIVPLERTLFALGMFMAYKLFSKLFAMRLQLSLNNEVTQAQ